MTFKDAYDALDGLVPGTEADSPKRLLIAVVDDDPAVLQSMEMVLRHHYDVRTFDNPLRAVDQITSEFSVVVLDVRMPHRDGQWVFRQLRDKGLEMPIILNTAYQDIEDPATVVKRYKPFRYLHKDSEINVVLEAIGAAANLHIRSASSKDAAQKMREVRNNLAKIHKGPGGKGKGSG